MAMKIMGLVVYNVAWAEAYLSTKWHLDPSSHLARIDIGWKVGALCPVFRRELSPHLTQCHQGRGLPPHQVLFRSIQPFGHNRWAEKWGVAVSPFCKGGGLSSHLTQCHLGRGLPSCQVSSWSIQTFGYNAPSLQTDRTDRQADQSREWVTQSDPWPKWPIELLTMTHVTHDPWVTGAVTPY